jgi:hypothetical protein
MTGNERTELFAALAELARRYPHWRVGQLVANVSGWADTEMWDVEDGQLLSAAREHLDLLAQRHEDTTAPNQTPHPTGRA